jgi:parallel beta-helix repeat protein
MFARKAFLFYITLAIASLCLGLGTAMAVEHSGTVCDETWTAADNPHNIVGNVTVPAGCSLTIEAGAEIFFQGSYYLRTAGVMNANGTSGNPVLFTKEVGVTAWNQLQFYNEGTGNLSYCTIEHASFGVYLAGTAAVTIDHCTIQSCSYGIYHSLSIVNPGHVITNNTIQNNSSFGVHFYGMTDALIGGGNSIKNNKAGIYFNDCDNAQIAAGNTISRNLDYGVYFYNLDEPVLLSGVSECGVGAFYEDCSNIGTLDNLTLTDNAEAALQIKDSGSFALGSNNIITGNGWPLAIDVGSFPDAASQIPTSGNLRNAIQIVAGSSSKTGIWPTFPNVDYILTGNNTIASGGNLTVSPGTTVKCQTNKYIRVDGGLNAVGTPENPITFTRQAADSWAGIHFYSASSGDIQYVQFEYANHGIYLSNTTSVSVQDCVFQHNNYGLYVDFGSNTQVTGSRFYYNSYGTYIAAGGTASFGGFGDDYNCFEGNRTYAIQNLNASAVTAEHNYWGDPNGPNHSSNPGGRGDLSSDNVDFTPYIWVCADVCACDLNQSGGSCNFFDWLAFIEDWGQNCTDPGADCECDLNQSGECNFFDWLLFIDDWGRTDCP